MCFLSSMFVIVNLDIYIMFLLWKYRLVTSNVTKNKYGRADDYEIQKGETLLCLDWWWVGRKERKVDINEEVVCVYA